MPGKGLGESGVALVALAAALLEEARNEEAERIPEEAQRIPEEAAESGDVSGDASEAALEGEVWLWQHKQRDVAAQALAAATLHGSLYAFAATDLKAEKVRDT